MIDHMLRPLKDRALAPVARAIGPGARPGFVSILGLGAGLVAAVLAFRSTYMAALGFWILNRLLDGLDGVLARTHGHQTDFGGYVDILADFVVYAAIPIAIVMGAPRSETSNWALAALLSSYYVNAASWMYLAAILERNGLGARQRGEQTAVVMPEGLIGGSETALAYVVFLIVPQHIAALFASMSALVMITILQRVVWAYRHLNSHTTS